MRMLGISMRRILLFHFRNKAFNRFGELFYRLLLFRRRNRRRPLLGIFFCRYINILTQLISCSRIFGCIPRYNFTPLFFIVQII